MLLKWQANGQLKLDCTELYAQYSQNVAHLYVLTDVLNKNDGQMFAQFGKWDSATMQYVPLTDENGDSKLYLMGWKVLEKPDGESPSWLYDCYIPAELLTYKGAVCVTLKFQLNGQSGDTNEPTAIFATGNLGFNIEGNLPSGQIIPSDSQLAALIDKINALELNSMTASNTTAEAETLPPNSEATVSITSTTDSAGQKHFVFTFGIPKGVKGDAGIGNAVLTNEDGDSDENGFTQQLINQKFAGVNTQIESLLSNEDGDSETLGYTQVAVNRIAENTATAIATEIANAKVVNAPGTSETQAYSQSAANATFSNPNLLINPDFKINQRGQTSYSGAVYGWDRWKAQVELTTVNTQTGIISCSTGSRFLEQKIEDYESLRGKTLTATFAYKDLVFSGVSFYLQIHDGVNYINSTFTTAPSGVITMTFTVAENATKLSVYLVREDNTEISVKPLWAKLEVGSVATPFIPPVTSEELPKCQRYYYRLQPSGNQLLLGTGSFCVSGNNKQCIVPFTFPVTMRQPPTITYDVERTGGGGAVARITYAVLNYTSAEVYVYGGMFLFTAQYYESTIGQSCDVFITNLTSSNISFDAEIY